MGQEITIKEIVTLFVELTSYRDELHWDTAKPDGQPRRALDTSRACERFGFAAQSSFREGLRRTVEWHEATLLKASCRAQR